MQPADNRSREFRYRNSGELYEPSEADKALMRRVFPGFDPANPDWDLVWDRAIELGLDVDPDMDTGEFLDQVERLFPPTQDS